MATSLKELAQRTDASVRRRDPEALDLARDLSAVLSALLAEGNAWLERFGMEAKEP